MSQEMLAARAGVKMMYFLCNEFPFQDWRAEFEAQNMRTRNCPLECTQGAVNHGTGDLAYLRFSKSFPETVMPRLSSTKIKLKSSKGKWEENFLGEGEAYMKALRWENSVLAFQEL